MFSHPGRLGWPRPLLPVSEAQIESENSACYKNWWCWKFWHFSHVYDTGLGCFGTEVCCASLVPFQKCKFRLAIFALLEPFWPVCVITVHYQTTLHPRHYTFLLSFLSCSTSDWHKQTIQWAQRSPLLHFCYFIWKFCYIWGEKWVMLCNPLTLSTDKYDVIIDPFKSFSSVIFYG